MAAVGSQLFCRVLAKSSDRFLTLLAQGGEGLDWSAVGQPPAKDAGEADRLR